MATLRNKKKIGPIEVPDTTSLSHGVEDAANRLSAVVETAGARTTKTATRTTKTAKKSAKQARDQASALGDQLSDRVNHAQSELIDRVSHAQGELSDRVNQAQNDRKRARRRRRLLLPFRRRQDSDAVLRAQLAKTSHELSRESTDLNRAVSSLNSVIKANRKAAARGRSRLIGGVLIGAVLMYHLDSEHGKERRQASVRRLRGVAGISSS
jgi:gas vesicle protein